MHIINTALSNTVHFSKPSKLLLFYWIIITIWWCIFYFAGIKQTTGNYLYQLGMAFVPLAGGFCGILQSKRWGGHKSQVGKALLFISLGLISWGVGQIFWSVLYNLVLKVEIPYPSLADLGYIIAVPFWTYGIINLSKATGAKFSLKNMNGKLIAFIIPVVAILVSYYLLVMVARGGVISSNHGLKLFFDFAYPIGDVIILTLSLLIYGLSFNYLGGKLKIPILTLILGFVAMYFTDFTFSYVTTIGDYFNGHWVDFMFTVSLLLMGLGINNFELKEK